MPNMENCLFKAERICKSTSACTAPKDLHMFKTDETGDNPDVVFFCTPGTKLELYPLDLLAKDIDPGNPPAPGSGFGGITLAYNTITKEEVVEI